MHEKYFFIDTNIILEDNSNILKLSQNSKNLIIISEIVLDEIDSKKSGFDEINFQAREFARFLESGEIIGKKTFEDMKIISLDICSDSEKVRIDIISKNNYIATLSGFSQNILNDRKILETAQSAQKIYPKK